MAECPTACLLDLSYTIPKENGETTTESPTACLLEFSDSENKEKVDVVKESPEVDLLSLPKGGDQEELKAAISTECPTACLLNLSCPEDKENSDDGAVSADSVEFLRSDDTDSKLSFTISKSLDFEEKVSNYFTETNSASNTDVLDNPKSIDDNWLENEIFDFNLVDSSPESEGEDTKDEEEIFFGPVGFNERCVAAVIADQAHIPMSPLNPKELAEVIKEGQFLASMFQNMGSSESDESSLASSQILTKYHVRNRTFSKEKEVLKMNSNSSKATNISKVSGLKKQQKLKPLAQTSKDSISSENKENKASAANQQGSEQKGLSRLPKSNSATNLTKGLSCENLTEVNKPKQRYESGDSESSKCSVASENNDSSFSRHSSTRRSFTTKMKAPLSIGKPSQAPMIRPSLTTLPKAGASRLTARNLSRQEGPLKSKHVLSTSNSSLDSISSQSSSISNSSMGKSAIKSSLPSRASLLGKPVIKSATAKSSKPTVAQPKVALDKLQLKMTKPVLQKNASVTNTRKSINGPMKAVDPPKFGGMSAANKSFVEKGIMKNKIGTPSGSEKKSFKRLSSSGTVGKSSSLSSNGSTSSIPESPSSRKRHSLLPTPSKSRPRSISGRPLSCRSSNSSISSRHGASFSDVTDSPVFGKENNQKK